MADSTTKTPGKKTPSKKTTAKKAPAKAATSSSAPKKTKAPAASVAPKQGAATSAATKSKGGNSGGAAVVSPEQRWHMVAEAAYHRAEKRGFMGGDPLADWVEAEKEIDALLAARARKL